jgi:CHASE3 domain sensor protein
MMNSQQKKLALLVLALLLVGVVVIAVLYTRQRLFTRTEPIVLAS